MQKKLAVALVAALAIVGIWVGARLYLSFGAACGSESDLHSDLLVEDGSIGIPGITKTYEAELHNCSLVPIRVEVCDFIDDVGYHGTMVAYAVQRWDPTASEWKTIVELSGSGFCRPIPLSMNQAEAKRRLLWPGGSISTGWEATAARTGIRKGDAVRFLVFTRIGGSQDSAARGVPTRAFQITEGLEDTTTPYKFRH